jgi:hypothetical protein
MLNFYDIVFWHCKISLVFRDLNFDFKLKKFQTMLQQTIKTFTNKNHEKNKHKLSKK